jgi:hypothetical protein
MLGADELHDEIAHDEYRIALFSSGINHRATLFNCSPDAPPIG